MRRAWTTAHGRTAINSATGAESVRGESDMGWVWDVQSRSLRTSRPPLFEIMCSVLLREQPAALVNFIALSNALVFKVRWRADDAMGLERTAHARRARKHRARGAFGLFRGRARRKRRRPRPRTSA